jgi:hypothetical protein
MMRATKKRKIARHDSPGSTEFCHLFYEDTIYVHNSLMPGAASFCSKYLSIVGLVSNA